MTGELPATAALPAVSDPSFERFARLVRHQLGVPVALVSLVSVDGQVFPGALGLPEPYQSERSTPLSHSFCQHVVRAGAPLVIGDTRLDPLVRDNPAIDDIGAIAYAGVPLVDAEGAVVGSLCAIDTRPRTWSEPDLAVLHDLADACSAELQLRAIRRRAEAATARAEAATRHARELLVRHEADRGRWELALESGRVGTFAWDLATGELSWDRRLLGMVGLSEQEFDRTPAAFDRVLVPEDRDRVDAVIATAMANPGPYEVEFRVRTTTGATRWIQTRGQVLTDGSGAPVSLLGAAYDTTTVHDGETRTTRVLEAMPSGFLSLDTEWRFTVLNAAAEQLVGHTREQLLGRTMWEAFPESVGNVFETTYRTAVETGVPQTLNAYYPAPLNAWHDILCWPSPEGLSLYFSDVTERTRTARRAEVAGARLALVAQVTSDLVEAVDIEAALGGLARLIVPTLADGCIVTVLDPDGRPRDIAGWHADADVRGVLQRYTATRLQQMPVTSPIARVLATGLPVASTGDEVGQLLPDGSAHADVARLGAAHGLVLPIQGRGRVLGALSLFSGPDRDRDPDDEATATDIANRAGLALDNARLLATQSHVAEELQRSLLTRPPEAEQAEIVVRYVPATETARVGGDWYDAFGQADGSTVVVIGDVVGHDIEAAAAMSQLRGLLRGVATYSGAGPAEVLRGLDRAMQLLRIPTLATAAVARFEHPAPGSPAGSTRLVWSNAGHMAPVVIHPDGAMVVLAPARAELLLGVDPRTTRTEHAIDLAPGTTVLLFTDGLIERRRSNLDDDLLRLEDTITALGPRTLDELCDGLISRLTAEQNDDDIALVAVRLHPRDRPGRRPRTPRPPGPAPTVPGR